ncbi:MAG: hypothetical protein IIT98_06050, partial [Kiritimatiellae bacterium]|nr:hypothetical protein [Kiritimatiellia bacterium]
SCVAIESAMDDIRKNRVQPVPEHLKNKHIGAIGSEKSSGYKYPHDYAGNYVEQAYMRVPKRYYVPNGQGYEATISKRLESLSRS